ncbi:MAG: hypothetical protein V4493_01210 [Pseudomonadota bacterium]
MTDITRKRGDTYADGFILKNADTGDVIDITDCTFVLTVDPSKAPVDATNNLYSLVGDITDSLEGKVEFAPDVNQADHVGTFYFDVQMTDGAGRKRTVDSGKYKYIQDITKS